MNCSSFEMQSLFMLVRCSWASTRSASCRLLGSRTVMTRVGSSGSTADGPLLAQLGQHLLDFLVGLGLFELRQGIAGGEGVADNAPQPKDLPVERHPIGAAVVQFLGHSLDFRLLLAGNHCISPSDVLTYFPETPSMRGDDL